jgi:hypothetical protein
LARSWSDIFAVFFADLYDDLRDKQDNGYKLSMRFMYYHRISFGIVAVEDE